MGPTHVWDVAVLSAEWQVGIGGDGVLKRELETPWLNFPKATSSESLYPADANEVNHNPSRYFDNS